MQLGNSQFYSKLAEFELSTNKISVDTSQILNGVNDFMDLIVYRRYKHLRIYDRICDHNGGKLITNNGKTSCPLHGWEFDATSGEYINAKCTKQPLYDGVIENGQTIELDLNFLQRKLEDFKNQLDFQIRFLNHACLLITLPGFKFATDPWLVG